MMKSSVKTFAFCLLACAWGLIGCTDDKYDLSDLDMTMALGSDQLQLPVKNSVKDILLDDILDIGDSESVTTDENGNYKYEQSSTIDDVTDIKVEKISLAKAGDPVENPVILTVGAFPDGTPEGTEAPYNGGDVEGQIETFDYTSDEQTQVIDLSSGELEGEMTLTVYFSSKLREVVETIDEMSIELPPYMDFEVKEMSDNAERQGNVIKFTNQTTDNQAFVKINVTKLDFAADKNTLAGNSLKFDTDKKIVEMHGKVNVYAKISKTKKRTIADDGYPDAAIRSTLVIDDIMVNSALGKFDPDITIEDSKIELNDLPDFLTDDDVVVDLYNPQIIFTATSQLPMPGTINVTLEAKMNDGTVIKTIEVDGIKVLKEGHNKVCLSRLEQDIPSGCTDYKVVPNLSEIIEKVPDVIEVRIAAKADASQDYTLEFGYNYSLTGIEYSILAPLAFGDKARVIYNDYVDGWAEDMPDDMDFEEGAYIEVKAVDVNKNEIDNVTCQVDKDIAGSADGNVVTTPIRILIKRNNNVGSLTDVDGIHFILEAASNDTLKGKTLNATENKLTARDITVTIHGRVIADFN